jgi:sulfur carrier protein
LNLDFRIPKLRGMLDVVVNGEPQAIQAGTTVAQLLEGLQLKPRFVAVERNRNLIPRAEHAACVLETGDRLEIVTLVGGG